MTLIIVDSIVLQNRAIVKDLHLRYQHLIIFIQLLQDTYILVKIPGCSSYDTLNFKPLLSVSMLVDQRVPVVWNK